MRRLAAHYARMRDSCQDDELCVMFDIDGTILDVRHQVLHTLYAYDRSHASAHFQGLGIEDVDVSENRVDELLDALDLTPSARRDVLRFYTERLWSPATLSAASVPFRGVLSVIRWFQIQPSTHVALNTGRPEAMRVGTLASLNELGAAFRVRFDPELLRMRRWTDPVPEAKVRGLQELRRMGLRVVAAVDNEPANIAAMAAADATGEVLYLHADTIFESQRRPTPHTVTGRDYRLAGLISEDAIRERVQLVWHGVNDRENLREYLCSGIRWAEVDVRMDPIGRLILRHDAFTDLAWGRHEAPLGFVECLAELRTNDRAIKVDLKENGSAMAGVLEALDAATIPDEDLWFNAELPVLGRRGFEEIRRTHPRATISCPVDFLVPLLLAAPQSADDVLEMLMSWGISRASLRWSSSARTSIDLLEERGWSVNVYGVPDLETFLEAALLLPASVTADFNFPDWHRFGRGSGEGGVRHRFDLEPAG
jgi:hypothetical protein